MLAQPMWSHSLPAFSSTTTARSGYVPDVAWGEEGAGLTRLFALFPPQVKKANDLTVLKYVEPKSPMVSAEEERRCAHGRLTNVVSFPVARAR